MPHEELCTQQGFAHVREEDSSNSKAPSCAYEPMLKELRAVFRTGKTKNIAWRKQQLGQIMKMIQENHQVFSEAVIDDHGGFKLRGFFEQIGPFQEAQFCRDNVEKWASAQKVKYDDGTPLNILGTSEIRQEPKGVVLIITPWNYPTQLSLMGVISAIAAGCCVVLKPSEVSVNSQNAMAELFPKYLDNSCFKVVVGAVPETTALLKLKWDHIMYTGNGFVGRIVMKAAAQHLTPVTLELGGKSPVYIDKSAKLDVTVERLVFSKFALNVGQTCIAPDYIMVHAEVEQQFLTKLKQKVLDTYGSDPKTSSDYGRIINARHTKRVSHLIAQTKGNTVVGGAETADAESRYIAPTVIHNPGIDEPIMTEEIFGPVLPVTSVADEEEAINAINEICAEPLALYIFAEDKNVVQKILNTTNSGGVCVNSTIEHILGKYLPFGGVGESGMGAYHGKHGFDEFTHKRGVLYKDTTLLTVGPPLKNHPKGLYDFAMKFMITGFFSRTTVQAIKVALYAFTLAIGIWVMKTRR